MLSAFDAIDQYAGPGHFSLETGAKSVDMGQTTLHYGPTLSGEIECLDGIKRVTFSDPVPRASIAMGVTVSITSLEITPTTMTATGSKFGIGFRRRINMSLEGM